MSQQTQMQTQTEAQLVDEFLFLDGLRISGATNMFGAASYLRDEFGLSNKMAREVLSGWMRTFGDCQPVEVRVERFLLEQEV